MYQQGVDSLSICGANSTKSGEQASKPVIPCMQCCGTPASSYDKIYILCDILQESDSGILPVLLVAMNVSRMSLGK